MKGQVVNVLLTIMAAAIFTPLAHAAPVEPSRIENQRGVFYVFTPPNQAVIEDYIVSRHKVLDQLFFQEAGNKYEAQVSFSRYLSEAELRAFSQRHKFIVTALNFGWSGQTGGHSLERSEGLDTAFEKVREHYEGLLADLEESISRKQASATAAEDKSRLNGFSAHASELRATYQARGCQYFGVKVYGTVESLKLSKDGDSTIRLMDVLWSQESDASGARGIRKISAPIVPESR